MTIKSYHELRRFTSYQERFNYLRLFGGVGEATFGFDRHINQSFYSSFEWKQVRHFVIVRDEACDLGIRGYEITSEILIHHINPMTPNDIIHGEEWILDPDYLITTTKNTHNAIHYGGEMAAPTKFVARSPGDTKLW